MTEVKPIEATLISLKPWNVPFSNVGDVGTYKSSFMRLHLSLTIGVDECT